MLITLSEFLELSLDVCDFRFGPQFLIEPEKDFAGDTHWKQFITTLVVQQGTCLAFGPNLRHAGGYNPFPFVRLHVHLDPPPEEQLKLQKLMAIAPPALPLSLNRKNPPREAKRPITCSISKEAKEQDSDLDPGRIGNRVVITTERKVPKGSTGRMRKMRQAKGGTIDNPRYLEDPHCMYYTEEEKMKHNYWIQQNILPTSPIGMEVKAPSKSTTRMKKRKSKEENVDKKPAAK